MHTQTQTHNDLTDLSVFDFPIATRQATYEFEGQQITLPRSKVLVHAGTGEFLGQHTERYQEVEHANLYSLFNNALDANGLAHDVEVTDKLKYCHPARL